MTTAKVNKISSEMFLKEFSGQWEIEINHTPEALIKKYYHATSWTDFMQSRGNFINKVMERINEDASLNLEYATEWSKVDCLFVSGEDLIGSNLTYPSEVHALVEHENGNDPEVEMWKLLHWRCPLKVIIFYDWSDEDRRRSERRGRWLKEKLQLFKDMADSVGVFHSEGSDTEYLFIIGTHRDEGGEIYWRWASLDSLVPTVFIGENQY